MLYLEHASGGMVFSVFCGLLRRVELALMVWRVLDGALRVGKCTLFSANDRV